MVLYNLGYKISVRINNLLGFNSVWLPKLQIKKILTSQTNPIVIDIGCNVGEFSELVLNYNKNSVVYAFDLHKSLAPILYKKFEKYKFNFYQIALSDFSGRGSIKSSTENDRKASLTKKNNKSFVKVDKLDFLLKKFNFSRISIIKIDTEGNDYKVLRGSEKILKITDIVIFEVMFKMIEFGNTPQDIINFLSNLEFKYFYRSTKYFGLVPIRYIKSYEIMTQNIVASRISLR